MPSMKILAVLSASICVLPCTTLVVHADDEPGPPTVGKVINFLYKLLDRSREEGYAERELYAKFKCYCDDNLKTTSTEIRTRTEDVTKMESHLQELVASDEEAKTQCTRLKEELDEHQVSQKQAAQIRQKAAWAFKSEAMDLHKAIALLDEALKILDRVEADQTKFTGRDHTRFMGTPRRSAKPASARLLSLNADVRHALIAVSSLLAPEHRAAVDSFLQAPINGVYTAQSSYIVGILKGMKETFESNLQNAVEVEQRDNEAHQKYMANAKTMQKDMTAEYQDKQAEMGQLESAISTTRVQIKTSKEALVSAEGFQSDLEPLCRKKAKEFEERKSLRAQEEAAIAETISILSSEDARHAARPPLGLLQISATPRKSDESVARKLLQRLVHKGGHLAKLDGLLQTKEDPFPVVFTEIAKILKLIEEEQRSDKENHEYCQKQTEKSKAELKEIRRTIDELQDGLDKLDEHVNKPQTGLLAQEKSTEDALEKNVANQKEETDMRKQDNLQYQKNVMQLNKAQIQLARAINVLEKYYESLDEVSNQPVEALVQQATTEVPPKTWDGSYSGQSKHAATETGAIGMIKYILSETEHQEAVAHQEEQEAQHDYEESMTKLVKEQREMEKNLVQIKNALAKAEQEHIDRKQDLKEANKDRTATEELLASIKPGCDFILDNFDLRTKNRQLEMQALKNAEKLLKSSPSYQAASIEMEAEEKN